MFDKKYIKDTDPKSDNWIIRMTYPDGKRRYASDGSVCGPVWPTFVVGIVLFIVLVVGIA